MDKARAPIGFLSMLRAIIASALLLLGATAAGAATITISPVPLGGFVTSDIGGLDCGGGVGAAGHTACTSGNIFGQVHLTANSYGGCWFVQWNVSTIGTSTANPLVFPMSIINLSGSATFQCPPAFTSANAATFQTLAAGSFSVTASGDPALSYWNPAGSLPSGVTLLPAIDGWTLSGTPAAGTGGVYPLTLTVGNGVLPNATQSFTLTVNQPPAITSAASAAFTVGAPGFFAVVAGDYPASTFAVSAGGLPTGVALAAGGTLSGTPASGTAGVYPVTITATNGIAPDATQSFTLTVNQAAGLIPPPTRNFEGMGQGFSGPDGAFLQRYLPSSTNIAVGPNHIVQVVNDSVTVFDKAGAALKGPVVINTLWTGSASICATDSIFPMVQYDRAADRWVVAHIVQSPPTSHLCVAVSTTADPAGSYHLYPFDYTVIAALPRLAVWPDGYYVTFEVYSFIIGTPVTYLGTNACVLDRANMLQGLASTQQCFTPSSIFRGLLPSDLDGSTPPPAGSPNYLVALGFDPNTLAVWKLHVDWATPANSSLSTPVILGTASYTALCNSVAGYSCIPQGGTTTTLQSLSERLMYRLAYRNFGDHESLVATHAVVAGTSGGMRWYELRSPGSSPVIFQQGTHAPDSNYRWAGSAAMDWQGNMALGYSVSSATMKPQIRYAARLAGDAAGQLAQGEATIVAGGGAQTGYVQWGDVTSMRIDPSDDCTFWYTNQYIPADGSFDWRTRIASFRIPSCVPPTMTVGRAVASTGTGTVTSSPAGINCGATCVASFAALSTVSLTPAPGTGSVFTGWGGACTGTGACNVTMDGPKTVTARFDLSASVADVGVSQSASPNPAGTGKDVVYTLSVTNGGPAVATGITLTDSLPPASTFVWASPGCANFVSTVTCTLGTLANAASAQVKVVVRPVVAGSITNTATVSATQGDPNLANDSSSSTITVNATPVATQVLRYRLYSPVTLEHHFTTDLNEYNVLGGYVGTWNQEGTVGKVLNNPGSFNGVTAVPYYRLYNTSTQWHHWTTDVNEYYTLVQFPWWTGEGVDGYILPTTTTGATQLYRLLYPFIPGLHHWTIDPTEYGILISTYGWIGEGGSGFVMQ